MSVKEVGAESDPWSERQPSRAGPVIERSKVRDALLDCDSPTQDPSRSVHFWCRVVEAAYMVLDLVRLRPTVQSAKCKERLELVGVM